MTAALIGAPLTIMAIFHFGSAEAQAWLAEESHAHRDQLARLRAGQFPDDAGGRRLADLGTRLGDRAKLIEYATAELELVVAAEHKLAGGEWSRDTARQWFDQRDRLRRGFGRVLRREIDLAMPLSRNDRWEIAELREEV